MVVFQQYANKRTKRTGDLSFQLFETVPFRSFSNQRRFCCYNCHQQIAIKQSLGWSWSWSWSCSRSCSCSCSSLLCFSFGLTLHHSTTTIVALHSLYNVYVYSIKTQHASFFCFSFLFFLFVSENDKYIYANIYIQLLWECK